MFLSRMPGVSITNLISGAVVAVTLIAACDARVVQSDKLHAVPSNSGEAKAVAQISEEWAKQWSAKNLDGMMALYTNDAVFLPATGSRISGREAIRELFAKALDANSSELHVQSKVTEQSGALAYDSGEYDETIRSGGVTRKGRGNYLVILRRDQKRQWHIVEHMWTDVRTAGQ